MITMEKIDYVISVTGADYSRVREALLSTDGNVDLAIQKIMGQDQGRAQAGGGKKEKSGKKKTVEDINDKISNLGEEILESVKEIWDKGNATRLVVMDEKDTVLLNVSMTIGAFWTIYAPLAALISLGIAVVAKWEFYVYLDNGEAINVKDYILKKHRIR